MFDKLEEYLNKNNYSCGMNEFFTLYEKELLQTNYKDFIEFKNNFNTVDIELLHNHKGDVNKIKNSQVFLFLCNKNDSNYFNLFKNWYNNTSFKNRLEFNNQLTDLFYFGLHGFESVLKKENLNYHQILKLIILKTENDIKNNFENKKINNPNDIFDFDGNYSVDNLNKSNRINDVIKTDYIDNLNNLFSKIFYTTRNQNESNRNESKYLNDILINLVKTLLKNNMFFLPNNKKASFFDKYINMFYYDLYISNDLTKDDFNQDNINKISDEHFISYYNLQNDYINLIDKYKNKIDSENYKHEINKYRDTIITNTFLTLKYENLNENLISNIVNNFYIKNFDFILNSRDENNYSVTDIFFVSLINKGYLKNKEINKFFLENVTKIEYIVGLSLSSDINVQLNYNKKYFPINLKDLFNLSGTIDNFIEFLSEKNILNDETINDIKLKYIFHILTKVKYTTSLGQNKITNANLNSYKTFLYNDINIIKDFFENTTELKNVLCYSTYNIAFLERIKSDFLFVKMLDYAKNKDDVIDYIKNNKESIDTLIELSDMCDYDFKLTKEFRKEMHELIWHNNYRENNFGSEISQKTYDFLYKFNFFSNKKNSINKNISLLQYNYGSIENSFSNNKKSPLNNELKKCLINDVDLNVCLKSFDSQLINDRLLAPNESYIESNDSPLISQSTKIDLYYEFGYKTNVLSLPKRNVYNLLSLLELVKLIGFENGLYDKKIKESIKDFIIKNKIQYDEINNILKEKLNDSILNNLDFNIDLLNQSKIEIEKIFFKRTSNSNQKKLKL